MQRIVLTVPREREFSAVADLVLAGLASRLELTLETIDDLQLAVETLLDHDGGDASVTIELEIRDGAIHASVGPFERRLLDNTVDGVGLSDRDGRCWVDLRKEVGV